MRKLIGNLNHILVYGKDFHVRRIVTLALHKNYVKAKLQEKQIAAAKAKRLKNTSAVIFADLPL